MKRARGWLSFYVFMLYIAWKRGLLRKFACFVLFRPIKTRSLNLLCVLDPIFRSVFKRFNWICSCLFCFQSQWVSTWTKIHSSNLQGNWERARVNEAKVGVFSHYFPLHCGLHFCSEIIKLLSDFWWESWTWGGGGGRGRAYSQLRT